MKVHVSAILQGAQRALALAGDRGARPARHQRRPRRSPARLARAHREDACRRPPRSRPRCSHARARTRSRSSTRAGIARRCRCCSARRCCASCCGAQVSPAWIAAWLALIVANQAWRGLLARAWTRRQPGARRDAPLGPLLVGRVHDRGRAVGPRGDRRCFRRRRRTRRCSSSASSASCWAASTSRPSTGPSFYGFVLPALVPLIVRVALEGDEVHLYTALVMSVACSASCSRSAHQLNDLLTRSLAMRYENVDLIERAEGAVARRARGARRGRGRQPRQEPAPRRGEPRPAPAAARARALHRGAGARARAAASGTRWSAASSAPSRRSRRQFEQLLDLSRLEAGALTPTHARVASRRCSRAWRASSQPQADAKGLALRVARDARSRCAATPRCSSASCATSSPTRSAYTNAGGVLIGARRRGDARRDRRDRHGRSASRPEHRERIFEEFYQVRDTRSEPRRTPAWASDSRSCAGWRRCSSTAIEVASRGGPRLALLASSPPRAAGTADLGRGRRGTGRRARTTGAGLDRRRAGRRDRRRSGVGRRDVGAVRDVGCADVAGGGDARRAC